jgi:C-methyltransferase
MHPTLVTEQQPRELIWTLSNAVVVSRCLHVVADLGVADHIAVQPVNADALASRCGADADALDRVLRLLAMHGVFEAVDGGFRHTPASELLRSDHPMSMRAYPRVRGLPGFAHAFARLDHSIRTGAPAFEAVHPDGIWGYFDEHPDEARVFGQAMAARAAADIAALLDAYDFAAFGTIADIGGGRGDLLRAILEAVPTARGILFELPGVVAALDFEHPRLSVHAGDFFVDPLPAADAYVLMEIVHDWRDEECVAILSAVRRAAPRGATVLLVENVLAEGAPDPRGRMLDVIMLALSGGRERTVRQMSGLLMRSGFTEGTLIDTAGNMRIVESTAV